MTTSIQISNNDTNQEQQRHVDFICELPNELIPLIMKHFETIELLNLLTVSKEWKEQLVACKSLWLSVTFRGHSALWKLISAAVLPKTIDFIPFSNNTVQLKLTSLSAPEDTTTTIPLLVKPLIYGTFLRLEYLEFCGCFIGDQPVDLAKAIDAVSNTLRYLKIVSVLPRPTTLYFENILASCQQLEGFWLDSSVILFPRHHTALITDANTTDDILTPATASTLKQLIIHADPLHDDDVERIVRLCPSIRRLYLNVIYSCTATDIILQHYDEHQLEYLNVSMYLLLLTDPPCSTWSPFEYIPKKENRRNSITLQQHTKEAEEEENIEGLRYLALQGFDKTVLTSLLQRYANTLEELYVYYNDTQSYIHNIANINNTILTQDMNVSGFLSKLRVLSISSSHDPTFMLSALLTHVSTKTLQSLQISSCNLSNNPIVLASIKALENLKSLQLRHSIYAHHDDIMDLLHHFSTNASNSNEKQQQLQSLLLSGTYFQIIDNAVLQGIAKIETLQDIAIHDAIKVTEQGMDDFCSTLQNCNKRLRSLRLNHVPAANHTTLRHLLSIQTLENIVLQDVDVCILDQDFLEFTEKGIHIEIYHNS